MIKREHRRVIKAHIGELVQTSSDYVLHADANEIDEDNGLIRILYRVWYVIPDRFDCADIGAIWSETAHIWIDPKSIECWDELGARDSHMKWDELGSGPDDICNSDIPRAAELAWIDWMAICGHWESMIDYYEGEGERFLKGFPKGSRKAYLQAKAERRSRADRPLMPRYRGGIATGMGIFSAEEYRELMADEKIQGK